jgi:hypothetical protein
VIRAQAIEYGYVVNQDAGASEPIIISVKAIADGKVFPAFAKLSVKLDLGPKAYAIEAIASMLARDLNIFTPDPCIVDFSDEFVESVHDHLIRERMRQSHRTVFATKKLPPGFSDVSKNNYPLNGDLLQQAVHIFAFDAAIENPDRGGNGKPNCMTNGELFAVIDHEKAFQQAVGLPLIGVGTPKKPWQLGGLQHYEQPNSHLFTNQINQLVRNSNHKIDLDSFADSWRSITDERLQQYGEVLPDAWFADRPKLEQLLHYLKEVRENIDGLTTEIHRVLRKTR